MLKDIDDEDYQLITLPRLHRMYTVSPPATMRLTPTSTPTFAVTTPPIPVKGPQERLLQVIEGDDDEACRTGMGE